jgi:hypothetical protein
MSNAGELKMLLLSSNAFWVEKLQQSFFAISIEMVYRSLYFFTQARHRGETNNVVAYLVANEKMLGILKRKRKSKKPSPLETIPILLTKKVKP